MPAARSRADAIALFLTGAGADGGSQSDPDLSLGAYRSSTRAGSMSWLLRDALRGVTVDHVAPENGSGTGSLVAVDGDRLVWTPPGGTAGTPVRIANGESRVVEGGGAGGESKFVLVTRTTADDLRGSMGVELAYAFNDAFGQQDRAVSYGKSYRCLSFYNRGGALVKDLKIWLGAACSHGCRLGLQYPTAAAFSSTSPLDTAMPSGVTFAAPASAAHTDVLSVPSLRPGEQVGVWVERLSPTTYAAEVVGDGPYLYWRLGESSGTSAADASGNGRGGTYAGGPSLGQAGPLAGDANAAVKWNGVGSYVSRAAVPSAADMSIGYWAKSPGANWNHTAWAFSHRAGNCAFAHPNAGGKDTDFYVFTGAGAATFIARLSPASVNVWRHYAFTYNGTSGAWATYLDGSPVASGTNLVSRSGVGNTATLYCGSDSLAAGRYSDAYQDEVAYYTRVVTAAEWLAQYQASQAALQPTVGATPRATLALNWSYTAVG